MAYVLRPDTVDPATAPLGGKARALAVLSHADLPIPPWFVLAPDALDPDSLTGLERATDADAARSVLDRLRLRDEARAELETALRELCPDGGLLAVRSSAADEDGAQHSFAGQLDSFLAVPPEQVIDKALAVWRSGFGERTYAYRREHGLPLPPRLPAVLVQRLIVPDAAGVAFGADPVSGRRRVAVVSAVFGLGSALVSGAADADTYRVDRDGTILERAVTDKRIAYRPDPSAADGVREESVSADRAGQPALTDEQVRAVADLARRCGRFFGRPQDIEWASAGGELFLLQSRPITTLAEHADPDGVRYLWDNSNIAESYSGVTTPLTFSFARRAYEAVYREFCRLISVPEAVIVAHDDVFRRMIGLVRGRIYYNLFSWYRMLALLPGFRANRRFMEQMMGVKEGLPDDLAEELGRAGWADRWRDRYRLFRSGLSFAGKHFTLSRRIRQFYERLDRVLGRERLDLSEVPAEEIAALYRRMESQLLTRWDAPIVNDFLAMIFFGVLRGLTARWCGDPAGNLHNDLLCGGGGIVSAEPAARVRELARIAAERPEVTHCLCDGSRREIERAMTRVPEFRKQYLAYLDKFGERCLEELKLESPTLFDDPLPLLRSVGHLARRYAAEGPSPENRGERDRRAEAEQRARAALAWRPFHRLIFGWVLRNARARIRDRENLRFERTRAFGVTRRIFLELGRRLHATDRLDDPADVFYLEVLEILGYIDGTVSTADLKGLVAVRKAEYDGYRRGEPPADRFETRGVVHQGNAYQPLVPPAPVDGEVRQGTGCCPGVVRGPVRVVLDPRAARLRGGEVLAAQQTDPGWIMLLPSASGLLVERGSLLSHSAIVSREMGIPAVVGLTGVTRWLHDGDWVELNGTTGVVRKIPPPSEGAVREQ